MNPDDAKMLVGQLLSASKEGIRATLIALDDHPVGKIAMELARAKFRGELESQADILAAVHEATRPK